MTTMPADSDSEPGTGPPAPTGRGDDGRALPVLPPRPAEEEPPLLEAERVPHRSPAAVRGPGAVRAAWTVAVFTDVVQWVLWPLFVGGGTSPLEAAVDVVVAAALVRLLGWHWAFLPGFLVELVPGVDLVPTWTAAVFLATRGRGRD